MFYCDDFFNMNLFKRFLFISGIAASAYSIRKLAEYLINRDIRMRRMNNGIDYLKLNKSITLGLAIADSKCKSLGNNSCTHLHDCNSCKLNYVLDMIKNAKHSLDLCNYFFTSDLVGKIFLEAKTKGVNVRVITDSNSVRQSYSQMGRLINNGIPVRFKKSNYIMHHKYVIIDNEVVIFGSLNFSMPGIHSNWESLVITSIPKLVNAFAHNFGDLWTSMEKCF